MSGNRNRFRPQAIGMAVFLTVVIGACASSSPSETGSDASGALRLALTETASEYHVPGVVAGVWIDGRPPWVMATGGLSASDHFPIRSVTKSFTVTVILQLERERKLSLDDPVSDYVPDVPNGDRITLAQLAGMTSGIADYSQNKEFQKAFVADFGAQWTPDQLIGYGLANAPLFKPGTDFGYSNTNTVLLGKVIEKVTGKPLATAYRDRILEPLALSQTSYPDIADIPVPHPAPLQLDSETGKFEELPTLNLSALGASGGLVSTLDDLHRWGQALGSGELIGSALQAKRQADTRQPDRPKYDQYGLGIGEVDGWWGHTGEGLGYQAAVFRRPEDGAVIVVLLNSTQEVNVATEIFQALAKQLPAAAAR